jgi:hypothetical protein
MLFSLEDAKRNIRKKELAAQLLSYPMSLSIHLNLPSLVFRCPGKYACFSHSIYSTFFFAKIHIFPLHKNCHRHLLSICTLSRLMPVHRSSSHQNHRRLARIEFSPHQLRKFTPQTEMCSSDLVAKDSICHRRQLFWDGGVLAYVDYFWRQRIKTYRKRTLQLSSIVIWQSRLSSGVTIIRKKE